MSRAKRRPTKKAVFIFLGLFLGIVAAVVFANFVRSEKKIEHEIESPYSVADAQFVRSMGSLLGPPLEGGNTITELLNGDAISPAMLNAIRGAQRTITFETFIYWSGKVG